MRLGATWLDPKVIQQFMLETFQVPFYLRRAIQVNFSPLTAEWQIEGKTKTGFNDVAAYETYGTSRANGYKILEDTLNLKDVRVYDTVEDGKPPWPSRSSRPSRTLLRVGFGRTRSAVKPWSSSIMSCSIPPGPGSMTAATSILWE